MSRAETLIAAIAKNATYIANLDAAGKKKPLTKRQQESRASAIEKFNAYVTEYAASLAASTTPPVTPPPPVIPGDAAAKRRSWTTIEAEDQINGALERANLGPAPTVAEKIAALGPLAGKAIALTQFGFPGEIPGVDYSLADQFGGIWGVQRTGDSGAFVTRVWQASQVVHEETTPMPALDWAEIGRAHGLNDNVDGPA